MLKANKLRTILTAKPFLVTALMNFNPKLSAIEGFDFLSEFGEGVVVFHFIFSFYHVLLIATNLTFLHSISLANTLLT